MTNIERYNVTLDTDVVEEARKLPQFSFTKLSTLLNSLLAQWVRDRTYEQSLLKNLKKLKMEDN